MATATATVADFDLLSIWTCSGGTITSGPGTATASKTFSISGIPSGAAIQSAVFTGNISYPYRPVRKLRISGIHTRATEESENIETIIPNKTNAPAVAEFVATENAEFLRVTANNNYSTSFVIGDYDSICGLVKKNSDAINALSFGTLGYSKHFSSSTTVYDNNDKLLTGNKIWVKADDGNVDNITVFLYNDKIARCTHNLTIDDYVTIQIFIKENAHADIVLGTSSGSIKIENVSWYGTSSKPYLKLISGSLSNVVFKYRMGDYDKPIYVYGDSYISLNTNQRWVYYITDKGFNPWLLDGYGGRGSADAIISFRNEMAIGKPKYLLWALGMNDPDSSTSINGIWKTAVDEVIAYCDANGIELVLATIPCTPTMHNEYKNAYVKSYAQANGKRYIDFAKAVGGEEYGDTWYTGMLASDNVHPLAPGAVALANRAIIDMPELCVK